MYKTYIETKHENRDRLGLSEMGKAGYLLTRPRIKVIQYRMISSESIQRRSYENLFSLYNIKEHSRKRIH